MVQQKLDIGFFTSMYSQTNGTAHAVRFLSEEIAKNGHNVHVYAPCIRNGYETPKTLYLHDIGGGRVSSKTEFPVSWPLHKYLFCQEKQLDLCHLHTHATVGGMAVNWAKFLGVPMIGTHNSPLQFYLAQYVPVIGKFLSKFPLAWRFERWMLQKYDLNSVATKSKKELLSGQADEILNLLSSYAKTLTLLVEYDKGKLKTAKGRKAKFVLTCEECQLSLS